MIGILIVLLVLAFTYVGTSSYREGISDDGLLSLSTYVNNLILTLGVCAWGYAVYRIAGVAWYWTFAIWRCGLYVSWSAFNAGDQVRRGLHSKDAKGISSGC